MDLWKEILCLAIDSVLFGLSYRQYSFFSNTIQRIKKAESLGVNPDPKKLNEEENQAVIVKGVVSALTKDLVHSFHSPQAKGVVQKITVTEHNISKNATGFWLDNKRLIQEVTNTVPFAVEEGKYQVEITDVRDTYILDLETVSAKFEPTRMSTVSYILSFFNGIRQQGIETTEEMLKEGTILTGIGELRIINNTRTLIAPSDGSAYILTVSPISSLVRRLKDEQTTMKWLMYLFGTVGCIIIGLMIRRGYKFYLFKINERETRRRIEELRSAQNNRILEFQQNDRELPDTQVCIICRTNFRDVVFVPCGHVCVCEICSMSLEDRCPVCRTGIQSRMAVFLT